MTKSHYVLAGPHSDPSADWMYWVVEGQLLAGPYPGSAGSEEHRNKIQTLLGAGVTSFVNLMEDDELLRFTPYQPIVRELAGQRVSFLQFPIRDASVPSPELMVGILDAIDDSIRQGRPVYVHCWGGMGRTGTVVGCWLLRHGLATADDVLSKLTQLRKKDVVRGRRESPETPEQREFVRGWPS